MRGFATASQINTMDSFDTSKNFLSYPSIDFVLPDDFVNDFGPFGDPSFHSGFVDENAIANGDMFGLNDSAAIIGVGLGDDHSASAGNFIFMDGYPSLFKEGGKNNGEDDEDDDDDDDDDHSSGTTTNTTNSTPSKMKSKVDRSKTLVSERRRRGRMKEKLYALRALVPNITKMDKASIVGDAVLYVQDLQKQAKKLKDEIGELEASLVGGANKHNDGQPHHHHHHLITQPIYRKILQMDVFDVEERGFYLRVVSNRGTGVAMSLHKALESLTSFNVQSSNLASASSPDRFILTSTLMMKEGEQNMDISNVKLWITGALLHQGFQLAVSP